MPNRSRCGKLGCAGAQRGFPVRAAEAPLRASPGGTRSRNARPCRPACEVRLEECDELVRALRQRATALRDLEKLRAHHGVHESARHDVAALAQREAERRARPRRPRPPRRAPPGCRADSPRRPLRTSRATSPVAGRPAAGEGSRVKGRSSSRLRGRTTAGRYRRRRRPGGRGSQAGVASLSISIFSVAKWAA
jgi:hypothetical protein